MKLELWLPILTALIAAIGGVLAYARQKKADRKHELISKRRQAYEGYLFAYLGSSDTFGKGTPEKLFALNSARMTVVLIGSDAVVRAVGALDEYAVRTSVGEQQLRDPGEFKKRFAVVVLAMRADVFERSQLNVEEMQNALPIK